MHPDAPTRAVRMNRAPFGAALLAGLWMLAAGGTVVADEGAVKNEIKAVERQLQRDKQKAAALKKERDRVARELSALRKDMIRTARTLQNNEAKVTALEASLAALQAEAAQKEAALSSRHRQLTQTLGVVGRLARHPPDALIALPERPENAVRTAILLRAAVPPLTEKAARLNVELTQLAALHTDLSAQRDDVRRATEDMSDKRKRLTDMVERKETLEERLATDQGKVAARLSDLASKAKDLKDLMVRLEAERKRQEAARRKREAEARKRGEKPKPAPEGGGIPANLAMPAEGRIVRRYGEADEFGAASKGVSIRTRGGAQVVSPISGEVVFARAFRGYGRTLIIAHGDGYHTLLVGLFRIDTGEGRRVEAGEPVGIMGDAAPDGPDLYVEVRRDGNPVNPVPLLANRNTKVRG